MDVICRCAGTALAGFVLAGCAAPILDRNGNPVDTRQGITAEQAPDVGPQPNADEVRSRLEAQGKSGVYIRAMYPIGFGARNAFGGNGRIESGWLVCYSHKRPSLLTREELVVDDGLLLQMASGGERKTMTGPGPTAWCKQRDPLRR